MVVRQKEMPFIHKHGEHFGRGELEAEIQVYIYVTRMLRERDF